MARTRVAARRFNRLFVLRPSRLRKMISVTLIFTFVLVQLLNGHKLFTPPALGTGRSMVSSLV